MAAEGTHTPSGQGVTGTSSGQTASHSETPQALKAWWAGFKNKKRKDEQPRADAPVATPARGIFGVPLAESVKFANVAISLMDDEGKSFTYGYVPIIVAKCGVYLKEQATDVEGIFRLNGSAKRIKELQTAFDSPDRYGKGLDWAGYTVHDAANVLRRYLNNLPQPIIPLEFYERFREPLRDEQPLPGTEGAAPVTRKEFDHEKAIVTYQQLITEVPDLNRQLLLYVLDLLAVFASKSDVNLMTSANLAAIFQPGVLSHPTHDMNPAAYRLSQNVLVFLIDNQDSFLIGMSGTAADEKTVREVQSGASTQKPASPSRPDYGRSPSSGSPSGEGKRFSGVRRNVSTSSKNSRRSSQGPATPMSERYANSSVYRSNTVPSKKSPALPTSRFNRGLESPNTPVALSPAIGATTHSATPLPATEPKNADVSGRSQATEGLSLAQAASSPSKTAIEASKEVDSQNPGANQHLAPPSKTRKVSDVLLNLTAGADKDGRVPNKLKKKRLPSASENSSAASLLAAEQSPGLPSARSPSRTPDLAGSAAQLEPLTTVVPDSESVTPTVDDAEPSTPVPTHNITAAVAVVETARDTPKTPTKSNHAHTLSELTARPRSVSRTSAHSKSSITDFSEIDHDQNDEARAQHREKKRRWRFSHSAKQSKSPARVGSNAGAEQSSSSVGSWHRSRKSISNETGSSAFESIPSYPLTTTTITGGSEGRSKVRDRSRDKDTEDDKEEKRGFFDKLKRKVNQVREDKKERDAEKDRAKSPQRDADRSNSKHSLSAIATETSSPKKPSIVQQTILEQKEAEAGSSHDVVQAETAPTAAAPGPAAELDAVENATFSSEASQTEKTADLPSKELEEVPGSVPATSATTVPTPALSEQTPATQDSVNKREGTIQTDDTVPAVEAKDTTKQEEFPPAASLIATTGPTQETT